MPKYIKDDVPMPTKFWDTSFNSHTGKTRDTVTKPKSIPDTGTSEYLRKY